MFLMITTALHQMWLNNRVTQNQQVSAWFAGEIHGAAYS